MEVLAKAKKDHFICQVSQQEMYKFMNEFHHSTTMQVGDVIDLGCGYNFLQDLHDTFLKLQKYVEVHEKTITMVTDVLRLVKKEQYENSHLHNTQESKVPSM